MIGWVLVTQLLFGFPGISQAAEVLQVREADLLQVGDGNRSYSVQLVCLRIDTEQKPAAEAWLRQELPRRTRVNLRPMGERQGVLLARVSRLNGSSDLSHGLIAAGLASPAACPGDPIAADGSSTGRIGATGGGTSGKALGEAGA